MINWNFLINTLKDQKCVLLLGPELSHNEDGKLIHEALCDFIDVENNPNIVSYYNKDEFFLFAGGMEKTLTYYEIKDFYAKNSNFATDAYAQIAQLPFSLIISITPDNYLKQAFDNAGFEYEFLHYNKTKNPKDIPPPSPEKPVLYNLFGTIEEEESLILTHDDLFDFLEASIGNSGLPTELKDTLNKADNLIFMGFGFDKWYMQLLLRILSRNKEKFKLALNKELAKDAKTFFINQFKINFGEYSTTDFINELHKKYDTAGILRKNEESEQTRQKQIKQLITDDEIEKAIKLLMETFEDSDEEDMIIMQSSKFNRLNRKIAKGILDNKEAEIELNQVKDALLQIAKLIDE